MQYRSEKTCAYMLEDMWKAFQIELRRRYLLTKTPEFLVNVFQQTSFEMIHAQQMPQPSKEIVSLQDSDPVNIPLDESAVFRLQLEENQSQKGQLQMQTSLVLNEAQKSRRPKRKISKQTDTATTERGVFAISEPLLSKDQLHLDKQIGQIKKQLYFMRRLRKQNEEEARLRLEQSLNRFPPSPPKNDFAFDFSGGLLLKQKPNLNKSLLSPTGGKSVDPEFQQQIKKKDKKDDQDQSNRDYLISRGASNSRDGKRILFGNMGKRQISHLPFIKLNDNIKLSENNRNANGPDTSRFTFKSYQSRGQSSFKHFVQVEKDKAERLYSLRKSSHLSQTTQEEEIRPLQVSFAPKKQSKRMQKYLNKLAEDKNRQFVSQLNKSSNFDRMNSPHDYSVHRYYRHNFNDDKRGICEQSLASLKINTSFFREVKFTQ